MARYEIGTDGPPVGDWSHCTYRGPDATLKGKGALVTRNARNQIIAQFDDIATGYGGGWHLFDGNVWEPDNDSIMDAFVNGDGKPWKGGLL